MPSLADVISDLSPDPWRFNDFKAYLSKNHCLETLQFIQDASRYRACYAEIVEGEQIPRVSLKRHYDYLQRLWEDLLGTYILPNGHHEVNLPSEVRTRLLGLRPSGLPPHPSELDEAVKIVHELMEDSILPGFVQSYISLDQPGDRGVMGWRRISGRLRRKISTPMSEWDHGDSGPRASGLNEDGEAILCTRRHLLGDAPISPHSHLVRPAIELFDYIVRGVRGIRWLKLPLEKDRAADIDIGAKDQYVSAKLLE
ncbi:RGS domain-containing protein [Fusarium solani]|uniref:RGS domain-containing protein n=1 Tax=Fusarium solani TaxID=169388 RepID=A0A9P9K407_FUSSL|nr:RGS domain-containing protein [Fusarium solani]KAH7248457.1 RGS domain-containing protein [Fusarium solani]